MKMVKPTKCERCDYEFKNISFRHDCPKCGALLTRQTYSTTPPRSDHLKETDGKFERRNTVDSHLCIGGPLDGKRYSLEPGRPDFSIAERPKLPTISFDPNAIREVSFKSTRYIVQNLSGVTFFTPDDMHPQDVVKRLLERYTSDNQTPGYPK